MPLRGGPFYLSTSRPWGSGPQRPHWGRWGPGAARWFLPSGGLRPTANADPPRHSGYRVWSLLRRRSLGLVDIFAEMQYTRPPAYGFGAVNLVGQLVYPVQKPKGQPNSKHNPNGPTKFRAPKTQRTGATQYRNRQKRWGQHANMTDTCQIQENDANRAKRLFSCGSQNITQPCS